MIRLWPAWRDSAGHPTRRHGAYQAERGRMSALCHRGRVTRPVLMVALLAALSATSAAQPGPALTSALAAGTTGGRHHAPPVAGASPAAVRPGTTEGRSPLLGQRAPALLLPSRAHRLDGLPPTVHPRRQAPPRALAWQTDSWPRPPIVRVLYNVQRTRAPRPRYSGSGIRPHVSCPERWEGPPYINRYDSYLPNGPNNTCKYLKTDIADTHLGSTSPAPVPASIALRGGAILEANVFVPSGGALTIAPGASVRACPPPRDQCGAGLYVSGRLNADGTPAHPIVLSGGSPVPGTWGGVAFWPGSHGSLRYVHLSYAGHLWQSGNSFGCIGCGHLTSLLVDTSSPTIDHTTIDHGKGTGIEIWMNPAYASLPPANPILTHDAFVDDAIWAVYYGTTPSQATVTNLRLVDNGLSASGPGKNAIGIATGVVTSTLTVSNPGLPLVVDGGYLTVSAGARFTVGAGLHVAFDSDRGGLVVDGTAQLNGTAAHPIVFTRLSASQDHWGGMAFRAGSHATLSYVHISYAACLYGFENALGCSHFTSVLVENSSPRITHCTIDHSPNKGIEVFDDTSSNDIQALPDPVLRDDRFVDVKSWAIYYDTPLSTRLVNNGLSASGTGGNVIGIASGHFTGTLTLGTPGLPVIVDGGDLYLDGAARLTAGAGTDIEFNGGALYVTSGTLTLRGTAARPVVVTGVATNGVRAPGSWRGLAFWPGSRGLLTYVHLSYAGAGGLGQSYGCSSVCGATNTSVLINGAGPTITHATIDHSKSNDVEVVAGGHPILHGDAFGPVPAGYDGVKNDASATGPPVDATRDWWGSASGPSGAGRGHGVPVGPGVRVCPWLTGPTGPASRAAACPRQ